VCFSPRSGANLCWRCLIGCKCWVVSAHRSPRQNRKFGLAPTVYSKVTIRSCKIGTALLSNQSVALLTLSNQSVALDGTAIAAPSGEATKTDGYISVVKRQKVMLCLLPNGCRSKNLFDKRINSSAQLAIDLTCTAICFLFRGDFSGTEQERPISVHTNFKLVNCAAKTSGESCGGPEPWL